MDSPIFCRVRSFDDHGRVEESGIPDRHAGFDAVPFGFYGGSHNAAVGGVVGGDNDRFSAKEGNKNIEGDVFGKAYGEKEKNEE